MPKLNKIFHHRTAAVSITLIAPDNRDEDVIKVLQDTITGLQEALDELMRRSNAINE